MADYIEFDFESDPDALAQLAFDYLRAKVDGWEPSAGHLDTWLVEAISRVAGEMMTIAGQVPKTVFRYFGANIANIPPINASPAAGNTTWTMRDDSGYTIPAGTTVGIRTTGDNLVSFQTLQAIVVEPGDTTTTEGQVTVIAIDSGEQGNGLQGAVELIDVLDFVDSVVTAGLTSGGADAETDDEYLARLQDQLQLSAPRPILPGDFASMARNISGVHRALAIDGYNPIDSSSDNERMITVVLTDINGDVVSSQTKTATADYLESLREVNFVVNAADPTYTTVDVTFIVSMYDGTDADDLIARVEAAIADYLNPETWGSPTTADSTVWINTTKVRYLEVAALINQVDGVNFIEQLTIGPAGEAQESADLDLDGVAPLPLPGTIVGTVS